MLCVEKGNSFAKIASAEFGAAIRELSATSSSRGSQQLIMAICSIAGSLAFAPALPRLSPALPAIQTRAAPINLLVDVPTAGAVLDHTAQLTAFADQGNNLAGIFFQASLPSYLIFLYFLGYEKNRTPKVAMFGFQFLLLFVLSTVFTGIVTKSVYSSSLADVDWLHGAAEALLTTSNLYVGLGFRAALAGDAPPAEGDGSFRYPAFAIFACVVLATALGPGVLNFAQHDAFLAGIGNLDANPLAGLGLSLRDEPVNALSIPTWAIHFSSVFEWLFAMGCVAQYAAATGNNRWRWLTYGMLPLHASGVAACTYHFFFNSADVKFLVELQAGLTLLGNTTVAIAALLIALSNGWTINEIPAAATRTFNNLNPFSDAPAAAPEPAEEAPPPLVTQEVLPGPLLAAELILGTVAFSYGLKYLEPALGLPYDPSAIVGWLICLTIPAAVGYNFASKPDPPPPKPA